MKTELKKEIMKNNNWLNGMIDYQNGDIMALNNAENDCPNIEEVKTAKKTAKILLKYDNANVRFKDIIFMSHWSYGCFVYHITNLKSYFEHLTLSAYKKEELIKDIIKMGAGKW